MEGFFYESIEADPEVIDFTLTRYGSSILDMVHDQAFEVIHAGLKSYQKERLWDTYRICLLRMTKDTFMSFEEFCKQSEKYEVKTVHTRDEILGNVAHLINDIKWRK